MILSPAKTLDLSKLSPAHESFIQASCDGDGDGEGSSVPSCDDKKTMELADILKSKSQKQLKDLLKVSDKIASSVKDYYNSFVTNSNTNINSNTNPKVHANVKPAIFSFNGPAFKGISIDPSTCDTSTMAYLQANLRIIDPLYGSLRPLDLIQPYRLEMATKDILKDLKLAQNINMEKGKGRPRQRQECKSLAEWWRESVTSSILEDMRGSGSGVLINLASDEYASAVDVEQITSSLSSSSSSSSKMKFIKVVFQQEGRVIAVHAKRARGLMVRYIADHQLEDIKGIKKFDLEGYRYCNEKSQLWGADYDDGSGNENGKDEDDNDDGCGVMVFDRKKNWKEEEENEGKAKKEAGKDSMDVQKKRKATKDKKVGKRTKTRTRSR